MQKLMNMTTSMKLCSTNDSTDKVDRQVANGKIDIYTITGSPTDKKPGNPIAKRTITTQITEGEAAIYNLSNKPGHFKSENGHFEQKCQDKKQNPRVSQTNQDIQSSDRTGDSNS